MAAEASIGVGRALFRSLRPHQWIKNLVVFAGVVFAGGWVNAEALPGQSHYDWPAIGRAVAAFLIFCGLSSAGYLVNDIKDIEADRAHPEKRRRPIASGLISPTVAAGVALLLFAACLLWSLYLARPGGETVSFAIAAAVYLGLTTWYSVYLKHFVIVDVLTIGVLFVTRALAGCYVIPVPPSPWIIVCTFFGALFIALCKRRAEVVDLDDEGLGGTRAVLAEYHTHHGYAGGLLDQMIQMAGTATILTYSMYTFFRPSEIGHEGEQAQLMLTIPFVVYGVLRYLYLIHKRDIGQKPERLFRDRGILINLALWALVVLLVTRGRSL